jgi:hypothetical protein
MDAAWIVLQGLNLVWAGHTAGGMRGTPAPKHARGIPAEIRTELLPNTVLMLQRAGYLSAVVRHVRASFLGLCVRIEGPQRKRSGNYM